MKPSTFKAGTVVKRKDGFPFPTDSMWAVTREPTKDERVPGMFSIAWLEGAQWIGDHEIQEVTSDEIARMAVKAVRQDNSDLLVKEVAEIKARYDSEVMRRRRLEKKAARANDAMEPLREKLRIAEKEIREFKLAEQVYRIRTAEETINTVKIEQIRGVLDEMWVQE